MKIIIASCIIASLPIIPIAIAQSNNSSSSRSTEETDIRSTEETDIIG